MRGDAVVRGACVRAVRAMRWDVAYFVAEDVGERFE